MAHGLTAAHRARSAPSTITDIPTIRVNAAECHESTGEYNSGAFHRTALAANPSRTPLKKSNIRFTAGITYTAQPLYQALQSTIQLAANPSKKPMSAELP